jgi:tripartite-type tricarboxylate transporter receptor subunit TctC
VYQTLVKAIKVAVDDPQWKAQADKLGLPMVYLGPDDTTALAKQLNEAAKVYLAK